MSSVFAIATFAQYADDLNKYSTPIDKTPARMPQANVHKQAFTPLFIAAVVVYGIISLSDQKTQIALYGDPNFQKKP